ncbi:Endonuclease, Uma2 family (restriction endonuclease fold) [Streptosporangium subroseum]|uniref:Endonuclease, Uma2 family (Restriction endonuclease fold) n=2 Tax=Streptosporangium subroseum TaxID=106412 RepID=A0A239JU49_9ACTN|nr:Endonuclease, Uma2 family (restriction endonuclease fold) [Streptosporangium subroseum]
MAMTTRGRPPGHTSPEDTSPARTARDLFETLPPTPGFRAEVIDGNLIMSPVGTPEHSWSATLLSYALQPVVMERKWRAHVGGVNVCIDGPRDSLIPDFVLAPADCPRWGTLELLSSGLILVTEVVSPGSARVDRDDKPRIYAAGGVPIMLLVDPIAASPAVTVLSDPQDGAYQIVTRVQMGKPVRLPSPVDFDLDTSIFL